jgi:hypothetical protein
MFRRNASRDSEQRDPEQLATFSLSLYTVMPI